jgi:predicted transglutaminase-like cysteine proteinase
VIGMSNWKSPLLATFALAIMLPGSLSVASERLASTAFENRAVTMRTFGAAPPPYGFVRFCEANPLECRTTASRPEPRVAATVERLAELDTVNRLVNRTIEPATDLEIYGVQEHWTLPTLRGDCEDYALLKRKLLIQRGWPASALLLTVVKDEKGEGHAVLTARTAQGDFVLDNKVEDIRLWHATSYDFVMRQSFVEPRAWVFLDPREAETPLPIAGLHRGASASSENDR